MTNKIYQIDEGRFKQLVKESYSISDFLRKANVGRGANATNNFYKRCLELNISLKHFHTKPLSKIDQIPEDEFIEIINSSNSYSDILKKIDLKTGRSPYQKIKSRCKALGIEFEKKYTKNKENSVKVEDIFIENSTYTNSNRLKKKAIENHLLENKCSICGNTGIWQGKKLILHLHHINGNHLDNRIENLTILCPNCHSQIHSKK